MAHTKNILIHLYYKLYTTLYKKKSIHIFKSILFLFILQVHNHFPDDAQQMLNGRLQIVLQYPQ